MATLQNPSLQHASEPAELSSKRSAKQFIVVSLANLVASVAVLMTISVLVVENWLSRRRVMDHKQ
jgi:hypothetical protein